MAGVLTVDITDESSRSSTLQRTPKRKQVIVAVFPDTKEGTKAFDGLKKAAEELKYKIERIPFERLDFGETDALDRFYSCSIAIADVTDRAYQAKLFYHLGLRESFDMRQNIVTYLDEQQSYRAGRRGSSIDSNTHASFNVSVFISHYSKKLYVHVASTCTCKSGVCTSYMYIV